MKIKNKLSIIQNNRKKCGQTYKNSQISNRKRATNKMIQNERVPLKDMPNTKNLSLMADGQINLKKQLIAKKTLYLILNIL